MTATTHTTPTTRSGAHAATRLRAEATALLEQIKSPAAERLDDDHDAAQQNTGKASR